MTSNSHFGLLGAQASRLLLVGARRRDRFYPTLRVPSEPFDKLRAGLPKESSAGWQTVQAGRLRSQWRH
jgi:hypothetical protein